MTKSNGSHQVVPNRQGGWGVKRGGGARTSSHHETKQEAVDTDRTASQSQHTELKG